MAPATYLVRTDTLKAKRLAKLSRKQQNNSSQAPAQLPRQQQNRSHDQQPSWQQRKQQGKDDQQNSQTQLMGKDNKKMPKLFGMFSPQGAKPEVRKSPEPSGVGERKPVHQPPVKAGFAKQPEFGRQGLQDDSDEDDSFDYINVDKPLTNIHGEIIDDIYFIKYL